MKTLKSILTSFILIALVGLSASAQSNKKIIAVVNEAEWCPACKKNSERAMKSFEKNNNDNVFSFIKNDLTNNETKLKSKEKLKKFGLLDAMSDYKGTGVIYFFNAETKSLISKIGISKSNEELAAAMLSAKTGKKSSSSHSGGGCN